MCKNCKHPTTDNNYSAFKDCTQVSQSEQYKTTSNRKKEIRNYVFSCPLRASQIRLFLNWWVNCRSETWLWGILSFIASLHSNVTCWSTASVCVCVCDCLSGAPLLSQPFSNQRNSISSSLSRLKTSTSMQKWCKSTELPLHTCQARWGMHR